MYWREYWRRISKCELFFSFLVIMRIKLSDTHKNKPYFKWYIYIPPYNYNYFILSSIHSSNHIVTSHQEWTITWTDHGPQQPRRQMRSQLNSTWTLEHPFAMQGHSNIPFWSYHRKRHTHAWTNIFWNFISRVSSWWREPQMEYLYSSCAILHSFSQFIFDIEMKLFFIPLNLLSFSLFPSVSSSLQWKIVAKWKWKENP